MTHAVTIRPSKAARDYIDELWDLLEGAGIPLGIDRALIEPHVTLSVVETESGHDELPSLARLEAWCRKFADSLPRIPLHLISVGIFPGDIPRDGPDDRGSVLYIGLPSRGSLGDAHEVFHQGLPEGCRIADAVYSASLWTPHITLAINLDPDLLEKAASIVLRHFRTLPSEADDLELYELMPVQRVLRMALGPCDCGMEKRTCSRCERIRFSL